MFIYQDFQGDNLSNSDYFIGANNEGQYQNQAYSNDINTERNN